MIFGMLRCVGAFLLPGVCAFGADAELMNLLPASTKVVAGVNAGQAKTTPFGQFLLSRMAAENHWTAKAGFDPRTDLQEILMETPGQPAQRGLVLAKGTFNVKLILGAAEASGHKIEAYHGIPVLTGKESTTAHAVAFLGDTIAIAGDADSVRAAIDRRGATSVAIDAGLAAQVAQLSESLDAWSISTVPLAALAQEKIQDEQLNALLNSDLLRSIQQSSGGVKFGQTVQFSGQAVADSSQNATALAQMVRFLGDMARSSAPAPAATAIASLLQTLRIGTEGNALHLAAALPEAQLESLVRSAHGN